MYAAVVAAIGGMGGAATNVASMPLEGDASRGTNNENWTSDAIEPSSSLSFQQEEDRPATGFVAAVVVVS